MSLNHALYIVLEAEGIFSDDVDDPGGKTKYGITESVAREHGYQGEMINYTIDRAKQIYIDSYWYPAKCDLLPSPLDIFVFDCAVNQGPGVAVKLLQKALGVAQDGVIGPVTRSRIQSASLSELCALFMADRALRYVGTRNFDKYGRGWLKRLFMVVEKA
jgi:lysozyme family protein